MAIVSSGQISLLSLQNEFGGSNPIGINEYYAAAGLVPPGTINGSGANIPTSGQISLSTFYGAQQTPVTLAVRVLLVAGGGGGGPRSGDDYGNPNGGAGAGGYVDASFNLPKGTYSFNIGGGGGNGNGGNTTGFGYTAYGGGRGGGADDQSGSAGGSGGGGAANGGGGGGATQPSVTSGTYGNGTGYGNSGTSNGQGGGAGGAGGGAGGAASGSAGGPGRSWINGTTYAAGGNSSGRNGGYGYDATFYGNGAGGSPQQGRGPVRATSGYQGIVIISYQWNLQLATGGSVTSSGSGISTTWYHTITSGSQTFTF
jgi:hypothetical protein